MEKEVLHLIFKDEHDKQFIIKIADPDGGIDSIQIEGVCEDIIESEVFGKDIIAVKAELVTTTVENYMW